MGVLEFIFAVLIIVPVALVMLFIFRKLTGEYNSAIKKERDLRSGKYRRDREFARYAELKDYRKDNPNYDAYRRKMEESSYNKNRER